ncbi:MAG: orc1/cdc6 family replication initiation protein [Nanoarchaeota archaeon]|nr:orc1/cdc6 family replication initiation protein [Nanoarchaeota archaeon]
MYEEKPVIKNSEIFTDDFIPTQLNHRDGQIKSIRDDLKPILNKQPGRHVFIYGPPGTGKTCTSLHITKELESETVSATYINCWETHSRFKVLYNILETLGMKLSIRTKGIATHELLDILKTRLKEKHCVVILDEVDQLEDDKILYDLITTSNLTLILISNTETVLADTDPRIRSRLASADNLEFSRYTNSEITEILKERASLGLVPHVVKPSQLESIADASAGDSRIAINILRIAAEDADKADTGKITDEHINKALPTAEKESKKKTIETMNDHQKIIYAVVNTTSKIQPSDLYTKYKKECKKQEIEPVKDRTIRKYIEKMVQYKLLLAEGDNKWRTYSASE